MTVHRWLLGVVAIFAAACGAPVGSADGGVDAGTGVDAGNGGQADAWLAAHNAQRAGVVPAAVPPIPDLTWNAAAAATAEGYAAKCQFQHNAARGNYGENIYAAGGAVSVTPARITEDWSSEKTDYTWATNTCGVGKVCGHYTQVVWRATTGFGCAIAVCTINSPFGGTDPWLFGVCDYAPPGNVIGQKPY